MKCNSDSDDSYTKTCAMNLNHCEKMSFLINSEWNNFAPPLILLLDQIY